MTKKEIVSLSLKLVGICCLIMAITHLSYAIYSIVSLFRQQGFWSMLTSITSLISLLLYLIPFVLLMLFGFYLIFSDKLPSKMVSSMIQEEKTTSFAFQDIQVLAFSIIGVWLLITSIPTLIRFIIQLVTIHFISQKSISVFQESFFIAHIIGTVLKIALGIYLFLGGKGLAKLWQKFQGTSPRPSAIED